LGGRNRRVHCDGSWAAGDQSNGGFVEVGAIVEADTADRGKTIEVWVHDCDAYASVSSMATTFFSLAVLRLMIGRACAMADDATAKG
jgi:hypothetical protein